MLVVAALLAGAAAATPSPAPARPHIVLALIDDWGHSDVGFTNRLVDDKLRTPRLDGLSSGDGAVILRNYYVQHICTPTRSVLLSGRYQIHTGLQHATIHPAQPNSLPTDIPLVGDHLRALNYSTHMCGKWHVGFYTEAACPWNRGFDSTMGYLTGSEDYTTHVSSDAGYDFRAGPAVNRRAKGQYSTDLIRERALAIISKHPHNCTLGNCSGGLFLYLPFQAVHAPLQAKPGWQSKFSRKSFPAGEAGENRFIYAAMVLEMDASVGAIVDELKSSGLYSNSVLLVSSDNGGEPTNGGYNWPYRGHKATLWEGGVKAVGFLHSPLLAGSPAVYDGLVHVSDWLPTFVNLGGGNASAITNLDGHDVWAAIASGAPSPRTELLHNIDLYGGASAGRPFGDAAIRVGELKLLSMGFRPSVSDWYQPPGCPPSVCNQQDSPPVPPAPGVACADDNVTSKLWLYNLTADPYERCNLAVSAQYASALERLLGRLAYYNATNVPVRYPKDDAAADPSRRSGREKGSWGPWRDGPNGNEL